MSGDRDYVELDYAIGEIVKEHLTKDGTQDQVYNASRCSVGFASPSGSWLCREEVIGLLELAFQAGRDEHTTCKVKYYELDEDSMED